MVHLLDLDDGDHRHGDVDVHRNVHILFLDSGDGDDVDGDDVDGDCDACDGGDGCGDGDGGSGDDSSNDGDFRVLLNQ